MLVWLKHLLPMGCGSSKLDGLEAVSLCRRRSDELAAAIRHRYSLSSSHAAHAASLRSLAASLHRLLLDTGDNVPVLPLPSPKPKVPAASAHHSRSSSHISFRSSDSDTGDDDEFHLHSYGSSPVPISGPTYAGIQYARGKPPPPSVTFEQRPEAGNFVSGEPSSSSYPNYAYPYASSQPNYDSYYNVMGNFFGTSSPQVPRPEMPSSSSSSPVLKTAPPSPPPPPPPKASTWDFLNPFESFETYYPLYTPSRKSVEIREEEGIPELEEEEYEVIKEAYEDQMFVASTPAHSKMPAQYKDRGNGGYGGDSRSRSAWKSSSSEEEDVVEKAVAHEEKRSVAETAALSGLRDVSAAADEIKVQFDKAFECAMELSEVLEVGKQLYHQKNSVCRATSRVMCPMIRPSNCGEDQLDFEEDSVMSSQSLSSILQKIYVWEQKLYDEVRVEEKTRLIYDKNCKRLKHLYERGADARKIDATRMLVRKQLAKIRISIHVVDSISTKINKLRDEELGPKIIELIQGLSRLWKVMLECYRSQCWVLSEAKSLNSIAMNGKLSDTHTGAVVQLEMELLRWISSFSDWTNAQRNFVKALNGWLIMCLNYQPEVTADGFPPYSPGRMGAPPVFVICNNWSEAVDRISDRAVVEAVQAFVANVSYLWEQHDVERRLAVRDEKLLKTWERERQTVHKEVDALRKKLVLAPGSMYGEVQNQGRDAKPSSFQLGLKQIFKTMEDFTASASEVYEELHLRSEEEMAGREKAEVS